MNPALEALREHRPTVDDVAEMLYGDGAWVISKALDAATQKKQRRQAQVGLGSNALGIAAGLAGTGAALRDERFAAGGKVAGKLYRMGGKLPKPISSKGGRAGALLAGGALGLQVANIAGDAVANRVLARSAKKSPTVVKKDTAPMKHSSAEIKGRLVKVAADKSFKAVGNHGPKVADFGRKIGSKVSEEAPKMKLKAKQITKSMDVTWVGEISKADDEKRQIFGWASIVELDGKPVVDLQGDYLSVEEIEKAAYDYVLTSRKGGNQHQREGEGPRHVSDMIESMLVTQEKKEALGLPPSSPTGWWVGFQVNDEDTWQEYKTGKKTGFSIHGSGVRKELTLDD